METEQHVTKKNVEIKQEIRKCLETNKNENKTIQNLGDRAKEI